MKPSASRSPSTLEAKLQAIAQMLAATNTHSRALLSHWIRAATPRLAKFYQQAYQILDPDGAQIVARALAEDRLAVQQLLPVRFEPLQPKPSTFIDLFAGIGGFRLALEAFGWHWRLSAGIGGFRLALRIL